MESPEVQKLIRLAIPFVPILAAVIEVVKPAFPFNKKFIPLTAAVLGVAFGLIAFSVSVTGGLAGLIAGLGATGAYEVGKSATSR
jgi:hypothetical protein